MTEGPDYLEFDSVILKRASLVFGIRPCGMKKNDPWKEGLWLSGQMGKGSITLT